MPYTRLTVKIPKSVWLREVSRTYPETRFRVIATIPNASTSVTQIEILGGDYEKVCKAIRESDAETDLTVLEKTADMYRIQIETNGSMLLTPLEECGAPPEMPFEIRDGHMMLEITAPQQTLSDLKGTLNKFDMEFTVERIQQDVQTDSLLTERQQWLLEEAIKRGYYDTPRRTTLSDLAENLEIAKSTCSETLHRTEERLVKEYRYDNQVRNPTYQVSPSG